MTVKKRILWAAVCCVLVLLTGAVLAEGSAWGLWREGYSPRAVRAAEAAALPQGADFSAREEEIFRLGYAAGFDGAGGGEKDEKEVTFVLNINKHKFHAPGCESADKIKEKNRRAFTGTRQELLDLGFSPCQRCSP